MFIKSFNTSSPSRSLFSKTSFLILYFFILSKTRAFGLLQYIFSIDISSFSLNLIIIFSALDPLPEANMTIFFKDNFAKFC